MEPVLRWAGGKRQILSILLGYITPQMLNGHRYFEPFVGGGSVAFALEYPNTTISDYNPELINAYRVIRDNPDQLIDLLKIHANNHCKEYYYRIRALDQEESYIQSSSVEKAARMIYLNRTCFNGLYRVNRKNHFNVPLGRESSNGIVQESIVRDLSNYLNGKGIKILEGNFIDCVRGVKAGDVIYFDPPYDYEDTGFNKYVTNIFGHKELEQLRYLSLVLIQKGCTVILSNNDTRFVRELFSDSVFTINPIEAKRYINCKPDRRSGIKEVIIVGKTDK